MPNQPPPVPSTPLVVRALEERDLERLELDEQTETMLRGYLDRTDWSGRGIRAFVAEVPTPAGDSSAPVIVGRALAGRGYPPYFPPLDDSVEQLYLASIHVLEQFQRRGYGARMLQFFVDEARRLGAKVFRAECEKGWRVDHFYARAGFQAVPYRGPADNYPDSHQMLELWL
jgi:GNAT superfamily N-acetyltransferase